MESVKYCEKCKKDCETRVKGIQIRCKKCGSFICRKEPNSIHTFSLDEETKKTYHALKKIGFKSTLKVKGLEL